MLFIYCLLFLAVTFNTVSFVLRGGRYKNYYIALFYCLVYVIIFLRMAWLSLILFTVNQYYDG